MSDKSIVQNKQVFGSAWHGINFRYENILQTVVDWWKLWSTQYYYVCAKSRLLQVIQFWSFYIWQAQKVMFCSVVGNCIHFRFIFMSHENLELDNFMIFMFWIIFIFCPSFLQKIRWGIALWFYEWRKIRFFRILENCSCSKWNADCLWPCFVFVSYNTKKKKKRKTKLQKWIVSKTEEYHGHSYFTAISCWTFLDILLSSPQCTSLEPLDGKKCSINKLFWDKEDTCIRSLCQEFRMLNSKLSSIFGKTLPLVGS